jgi:regulator of replication initiation timing
MTSKTQETMKAKEAILRECDKRWQDAYLAKEDFNAKAFIDGAEYALSLSTASAFPPQPETAEQKANSIDLNIYVNHLSKIVGVDKQPETQETMKEKNKVTNLPEVIYLQLHDGLLEETVDFKQLYGVTWCEDRINDSDVPYVLSTASASLKQPEAQPQQEGEEGRVINIPEVIYLQLQDGLLETEVDFNQLAGVTWCQDRINDTDVAYVLQSQLSTLTAENAKLKDRLTDQFNINVHLQDENAKLWKALEEEYKYHLRFVSESSVSCDEMDGYMEHNWQQFKSNLLAK